MTKKIILDNKIAIDITKNYSLLFLDNSIYRIYCNSDTHYMFISSNDQNFESREPCNCSEETKFKNIIIKNNYEK